MDNIIHDVTPLDVKAGPLYARSLHRVWRALNDGDCPKCHTLITQPSRTSLFIRCTSCNFTIWLCEIERIQVLFSDIMDSNVADFGNWRSKNAEQILESSELHPATYWEKFLSASVIDPDGWRHPGMSWHDEITAKEFAKRWSQSTCRQPPSPELEALLKGLFGEK